MEEDAFLDYLSQEKLLSKEQYNHCFEKKGTSSVSLTDFLITENYLDLETLTKAFAEFSSQQKTNPPTPSPTTFDLLQEIENVETNQELGNSFNSKEKTAIELAPKGDTLLTPISQKTKNSPTSPSTQSFLNQAPLSAEERYKILENLGEGGMGIVQRAEDRLLGREVALKRIKTQKKTTTQLSKKQLALLWRLHREASITAILEHPNIVPLYDMQKKSNGDLYFTMRKVEGKSLRELLLAQRAKRIQQSESKRLSIFEKVCEAISYAHSRGVIHRDLKPDNIMVGQFGEVYVMDWGIAKLTHETEHQLNELEALTMPENIDVEEYQTIGGMGTRGYMPPEQQEDAATVKIQADIYALGKMLKEIFTLLSPSEEFQHQIKQNQIQMNAQSQGKKISTPKPIESMISLDIQAIIQKATEYEWSDRYLSVQELIDDLERYHKNTGVTARHYSPLELTKKWLQRNRQRLVVIALMMLFVSLTFGYSYWSKHQEQLKNFQESYSKAKQEILNSDQIFEKEKQLLGKKIHHLLNAIKYLNDILVLQPRHQEAEELKKIAGEILVRLCCQSQDYQLASYVIMDMSSLSILPLKEKQTLENLVSSKQNQLLKKHQERFNFWLQELKKPLQNQKLGIHERAKLEISKMQEEEIFKKLLKELANARNYFLNHSTYNQTQIEYYNTFILSLGQLENPKAGPFLIKVLEECNKKIAPLPLEARPVPVVNFMINLTLALDNSSPLPYQKKLFQIRKQMGRESFFWKGTELVYETLANAKTSGEIPANLTPIDYLKNGDLNYSQNNFKEAILHYNKAIHLAPKLLEAYMMRASAHQAQQNFKEALLDYNKALKLNPKSSVIYRNRGLVKASQGNLVEALLDYNKALELTANDSIAYYRRGLIFKQQQQTKQALQDFSQAIQLNSQFVAAYQARSSLFQKENQLSKALKDLEEALKINPKAFQTYLARGQLKQKQKKFNEAILDYTEAIRLAPQQLESYFYRGQAKKEKGDPQNAQQDFLLFLQKTKNRKGQTQQKRQWILKNYPNLKE